jgi:hypothetical protein
MLLTGVAFAAVIAVLAPYVVRRRARPTGLHPGLADGADGVSIVFVLRKSAAPISGLVFLSTTSRFTARMQEDAAYLGIALVLTVIGFAITERRRRETWALVAFVLICSVLALGPTLHVGGVGHGPMPGTLLAHTPILRNATPQRFPMYTALAVGVIAALWLARARGRLAWLRWALVVAGAVMRSRAPSWTATRTTGYPRSSSTA